MPRDAVPTSFTCIQANLRHSHAASASFSQLLLDLNIDVALVQEPYAAPGRCDTSSRPSIDYLPEDYESFHNLGADHLYGAAIFARRSLRASIIQTFSSSHAVCVRISSRDSQLIFASVYLRPSTTSINSSLSTIFTACSPLQYAVMGIYANARSPLWNSRQLDNKGRELEGLLSGSVLGLANRPLNDLKFIPPSTSFIDVTLHGCCTDVMDWRFLDLPSLSDHPLIYFRSCTAGGRGQLTNSTSAPTIPPRQKRIHLPPAQSICVERYTTALNDALHTPPSLVNKEDIDHCVKSLETNIQSSARRFGYYSRERKELKKKMPWWTKDLWGLRNRLRNAYNRACDGLKDGIRTPAVNAYRTLKSEYQRELRRAELASFKSFSADLSNDLSAALKAIKEESQPSITFPTKLMVQGTELTNPTEILTAFGHHFFPADPTTGDIHLATIHAATTALLQTGDTPPAVTDQEVTDAISSLKLSSSPGSDGIKAELVQLGPSAVTTRLRTIFDACLTTGHFPTTWKHATVSIVPKPNKPDYSSPSSYRPISVVNCGSKIFELTILSRLRWISEGDQWFSSHQHGFLRGRSTETAAHELVSFIERALGRKEITAAALIDIKSAFDSAWRRAIIAALAAKGCPTYLIRIIDRFLSRRTATLTANGFSIEIMIDTGCPQGSVFSAFLWIVLIDPALRLNISFEFCLLAYADDVTAIVAHRDPRIATARLQQICLAFAEWAESVKLVINIMKTVFILFARCHRSSLEGIYLDLCGQRFSPALNAKFLGLLLDWRL